MEEIHIDERSSVPLVKTKIPAPLIFCVLCIQVCEAVNITVIFPFLAFMVEDMGYGGAYLGVYAGAFAASFNLAQFSSSLLW
jgi:hypothetical protein